MSVSLSELKCDAGDADAAPQPAAPLLLLDALLVLTVSRALRLLLDEMPSACLI